MAIKADPSKWLTGSKLAAARRAEKARELELQKQWMTGANAIKPSEIQTTPIQTTPPAVDVVTTPPVNVSSPTIEWKAVEAVQAVTPTTQVTTPVQNQVTTPTVTPTETPKTEPTTPVSTTQATTTPTVTETQKTGAKKWTNKAIEFNKLVEANRASGMDEQQAFEEAMKVTNPPTSTEGDLFNMLRAGQTIRDLEKKTPEFKNAQARLNTFNKFASYSIPTLSASIKNGELLSWTQAYNDLVNDPVQKARIDEAKKFNSTTVPDVTKVWEKKTEEIITSNPTTNEILSDGTISPEEYQSMLETPEITSKRKDVEAKKNEYDTLKATYDAVEDEVVAEYGGKASASRIAAIVADRRKRIYRDLQIATDTYNNALGTLTDMTSNQAKIVEMNLSLYKDQLAYQRGLAAEERAFGRQKSLAEFQSDLSLKQNQAEFEQKMAQQAQMASDPVMATQAVIDQYKKLGVFAGRSDADIIQSVQNDIASGMTLGESLTNLNKAFQSKDAYKNLTTKKTEWGQVWTKLNDTTLLNQATGEIKTVPAWTTTTTWVTPTGTFTSVNLWGKNVTLDTSASSSITNAFNQIQSTGQKLIVGEWHRDQIATIKSMAERYGVSFNAQNPAETARILTEKWHTVAAPWLSKHETGMAIDLYSEGMKAPTAEQVAIMNANGWYQTAWANDMGHFEYLWTQGKTKTYDDNTIAVLWAVEKLDKQGKETLASNNLTEEDWAKFKAGLLPPTNIQKTQTSEVVALIDKMLAKDNKDALTDAVWTLKTPWFVWGTKRKDFESLFKNLKDNLAMQNLDKLKGAMSDKDIEFLRNTAAAIDLDNSEEFFVNQLQSLRNKYQWILSKGWPMSTSPNIWTWIKFGQNLQNVLNKYSK